MSLINNSRELAKALAESHKLDSHQFPQTADGAVIEYINTNWVVRGGSSRIFTVEQCIQKFGAEWPDVQCAFQKLGFIAEFVPQVTSGFLWWKRGSPAYLHVFIPEDDILSVEELDQD